MLDIKEKKGISLVFVILIVAIVLGISLGVSTILITQIEILRSIGHSVIAFYAADTGIEQVLLGTPPSDISETPLGNGASYTVDVTTGGSGDCDASLNYCIKSVGKYEAAKRAIEIIY